MKKWWVLGREPKLSLIWFCYRAHGYGETWGDIRSWKNVEDRYYLYKEDATQCKETFDYENWETKVVGEAGLKRLMIQQALRG